jgi:hypothetical protein
MIAAWTYVSSGTRVTTARPRSTTCTRTEDGAASGAAGNRIECDTGAHAAATTATTTGDAHLGSFMPSCIGASGM